MTFLYFYKTLQTDSPEDTASAHLNNLFQNDVVVILSSLSVYQVGLPNGGAQFLEKIHSFSFVSSQFGIAAGRRAPNQTLLYFSGKSFKSIIPFEWERKLTMIEGNLKKKTTTNDCGPSTWNRVLKVKWVNVWSVAESICVMARMFPLDGPCTQLCRLFRSHVSLALDLIAA